MPNRRRHARRQVRRAIFAALAAACCAAPAQQRITITGALRSPVEKSYRKMVHGMDFFEQARATIAPRATLRFRLLPRKPGTDMDHVLLEVIGTSFSEEVPVAPDHSFVLRRDRRALEEDAVVAANRRQLSMTWRAEIRTPGWPSGTRRLGDLRLECEVGLEADLVSNSNPLGRIADLFRDSRRYCDRPDTMYLFFAERPLFNVTLVAGSRREDLPSDRLYAMASDDPGLKDDLPYCDCEVLVDRTYFLPLGDHSWPDDTRVEFEYMDDPPARGTPGIAHRIGRDDVAAVLGKARLRPGYPDAAAKGRRSAPAPCTSARSRGNACGWCSRMNAINPSRTSQRRSKAAPEEAALTRMRSCIARSLASVTCTRQTRPSHSLEASHSRRASARSGSSGSV
jgi:hypothetical protein